MQVKIKDIKINPGRREADSEKVKELARSISQIGLLNPITVDWNNNLIAGRHRLEAAKLLGWTKIESSVSDLEGIAAEIAEIDENVVRKEPSALELGELLARRKELYETLNPEAKAGKAQAAGMNRAVGNNVSDKMSSTSKSFAQDAADKLGVSKRTIERSVKLATDISPEAREYIHSIGDPFNRSELTELSRLPEDQQKQAAEWLKAGVICSVKQYQSAKKEVNSDSEKGKFILSVVDLKRTDKDCSATPEMFIESYKADAETFREAMSWHCGEYYAPVLSKLSKKQIEQIRRINELLFKDMNELFDRIGQANNDAVCNKKPVVR